MSDHEDEHVAIRRPGSRARPKRPPPHLGGWRSRGGYDSIKALIAREHSRFKILPHADSPVGWCAWFLCAPEPTHRIPIYCGVCGEDASKRTTIQNFVGTGGSSGCACSYRPKFCTPEGRGVVAALAAQQKATLVVPADEWVEAHLTRSVRWTLVEVRCNDCGATRHISANGILHKKRVGSVCACQSPPHRAPRKRKASDAEGAAAVL